MGSAERNLKDIRDIPDDLLRSQKLLDGFLDAPLKLAEPLLARHEIRAAGLEDGPAFAFQPFREQSQEGGLADARLAACQERTRGLSRNRRLGIRQHVAPRLGLNEQIEFLALAPEASEGGEERAVDNRALLLVDLKDELARKSVVHTLKNAPDEGILRSRNGIERASETWLIAEPLGFVEILLGVQLNEGVVLPPFLGVDVGRADGRPRR